MKWLWHGLFGCPPLPISVTPEQWQAKRVELGDELYIDLTYCGCGRPRDG